MTAFAGLRVLLIAKFNQRYHRTGLALAAGLRELGCEVDTVDERPRGLDRILGRTLARRIGARLTRHRPDLVIAYKAAALVPEVIGELKARRSAQWVNWWPDGPHTLDTTLRLGAPYDRVFLFDSSMVERHRAAGRKADYLALGFDPEFYRPPANGATKTAPLVFVGSYEPHRERSLAGITGLGLETFGPGWPAGPRFGADLVRTLAGAKVGLNLHQFFDEPVDRGWYGTGANQRVFELAGVGTAQLSDAKQDIGRHFAENREIALYRTQGELRARAIALLEDDRGRNAMADAARARAVREHTWRHRLEEMLTAVVR
jgi:spore maturation protein CgeB